MTEQEILQKLTGVLRDVLGDDSVVLNMDTRREDVANWDSFAYVTFLVAAEMACGVKFGVAEVESFENVGDIVRRTTKLLAMR